MDLSIIILNYKTKNFLRTCLRGIRMFDHGLEYEIIVVDNDSRDGSVELVKTEFPDVKLIEATTNLGHAGGNNIGIKEARGKYVLLLNTDIAVLENSIRALYDFMETHPEAALAGPRLLNPDKTVQASSLRFPKMATPIFRRTVFGRLPYARRELASYSMEDCDRTKTRPVDWVMSSALMARREAIERVGGMDDAFFVYFADVDWCRRFWESGEKVWYVADAAMVHYHRRESADSGGFAGFFRPLTRIHIRDWMTYLKKYQGKKTPTGASL